MYDQSTEEEFSHHQSNHFIQPPLRHSDSPNILRSTHSRASTMPGRENFSPPIRLPQSPVPLNSPIPQSRQQFDSRRQPLQKIDINKPTSRLYDDDVFFPPSSARLLQPKTPDFKRSDGRTSREIKHDLKNVYTRVQENDRLSRLGSNGTNSRASNIPTSRLDQYPTTSRQEQYPVRHPVPSPSYEFERPVIAWSHRTDPLLASAQRSHSVDRHKISNQEQFRPQSRQSVPAEAPIRTRSTSNGHAMRVENNRAARPLQKSVNFASHHSHSDLDTKKRALLNQIRDNYAFLEGLLQPLVERTSNELPKDIMNALKERHKLVVASLKRIDKSGNLATSSRRSRLNNESNERKLEGLKCLSLILQIEAKFYSNGTDRPSSVPAVNDQLRLLGEIFSLTWDLT